MFKLNIKTVAILVVIIAVFLFIFLKTRPTTDSSRQDNQAPSQNTQDESPRIISTKPDPLDGAIVSATETIEIVFNHPLQNAPEFKTRIDPEIGYKIELSSDRKVARIIFSKPLDLGTTYTLFISPESKFDGSLRLDGEKIFHFKTITYRGV